jgi:hypothetical protein
LTGAFDLFISEPLIVAEIFVVEFDACPEITIIWPLFDVALKIVEESLATWLVVRLLVHVVIELWIEVNSDELAGVTLFGFLIRTEISISYVSHNSVT